MESLENKELSPYFWTYGKPEPPIPKVDDLPSMLLYYSGNNSMVYLEDKMIIAEYINPTNQTYFKKMSTLKERLSNAFYGNYIIFI